MSQSIASAQHLDDRYTSTGRVYLTGTQALIRLPMLQRERDLAAGLNTAGFISGYRGSPLGALDQQLWKAKPLSTAQSCARLVSHAAPCSWARPSPPRASTPSTTPRW